MSLDDLSDDVETAYGDLGETLTLDLDRETRHELAMLAAALGAEPDELAERAIHLLFQSSVDTAKLDFHLRGEYGVTYDEYLTGMTFDEMTGRDQYPQPDEERRYRF